MFVISTLQHHFNFSWIHRCYWLLKLHNKDLKHTDVKCLTCKSRLKWKNKSTAVTVPAIWTNVDYLCFKAISIEDLDVNHNAGTVWCHACIFEKVLMYKTKQVPLNMTFKRGDEGIHETPEISKFSHINIWWHPMHSHFPIISIYALQLTFHNYSLNKHNDHREKQDSVSKTDLVSCLSLLTTLMFLPANRMEFHFTVFITDKAYIPLVVCRQIKCSQSELKYTGFKGRT